MAVTMRDDPTTMRRRAGLREEPTPEQIQELCREIQKDWTAKERRRRAGQGRGYVSIMECRAPEGIV